MALRCYAASVATRLLKLVDHDPALRSGTCRTAAWSHPCGRALASQAVEESCASIFLVNVEGSRTISPVLLGRAFMAVYPGLPGTVHYHPKWRSCSLGRCHPKRLSIRRLDRGIHSILFWPSWLFPGRQGKSPARVMLSANRYVLNSLNSGICAANRCRDLPQFHNGAVAPCRAGKGCLWGCAWATRPDCCVQTADNPEPCSQPVR